MLDALSLCGPRTSVPRSPRYAEVTDARAGRDPTKTFRLRSKMRSEGDRRWALLNKTIRQAFIEHDLVGMRGVGRLPFADKSEGFAAWLRQELAHKVFGMDGRWLLPYVRHAAAIAQTHAEGHAPGSKVDPLRIKMMENYAVNELRGIVEAAQQQIVRMVTHSIMAADPPTKAANALASVFRTMRNRTRAMSEFVTAKTHATCTLSAFRNAGVTSVGIIPERHKLHDWGPEAWEASALARKGRAKALARIARAEAWARKYNKKRRGPKPGDRPNAAALGYSYSSENFGVDDSEGPGHPFRGNQYTTGESGGGEITAEQAIAHIDKKYPRAGKEVGGLEVLSHVPNTASIGAELGNEDKYTELPGIREVPFSAFGQQKPVRNKRTEYLAEQIKQNGQIKPLIVIEERSGLDKGPYVLEGSHRFDALMLAGKKSFPAVVVVSHDADQPGHPFRGNQYVAYQSWPMSEFSQHTNETFSRQQREGQVARGLKGYVGHAWTQEARSRVHSMPTHHVLRVEGAGAAFKRQAEKAGFKVYPSYGFRKDAIDARRKPLTPREAAELPWRGEQRVRVPISRPPWLQETENRPIEEVPSYEEVSIETAEDSDVCDLCSDLSEAGPYELDEAEDLIPAHPWAVLEGTTVASYGPVNEMVRARFVGPAVYLRTSAKFFAIGPNHPMLTDRGWLRAHEIKEGDKLLYDLRCEGAIGGASGAYFKQIPFIEDAFETFPLIMAGITGAKHDFHGDIRWCDDKIDVVFPASDLLQIAKLGSIQHGGEHRFARSNVPRHSLTEASTAQQFLLRIFHSACSFVGGANLHPALPFSHAAPFDNFLFRGTAQPNAGLNQRAHNHAPAGSVSTRKRDNAVAALIQRDYALLRWDRVLDVHVRQFSGWAFDASTTSGLYNNAGYIVSNCRCAFTPSRRGSVHDAGDLPGHPFRGNQYVTGEGGGGTEQFKAWFGNSKVVDKNGSPLVVYHGTTTPEDFSEFSVGEPQAQEHDEYWRAGSGGDPRTFLGSHFAEEARVANKFAGGLYGEREKQPEGGRVYPVFLKIENPYKTSDSGMFDRMMRGNYPHSDVDWELEEDGDIEETSAKYESDPEYRAEINERAVSNAAQRDEPDFSLAQEMAADYRANLQKEGYDGIKYTNEVEGGTSWVAFHPAQIKSAIVSKFSPNKPGIKDEVGLGRLVSQTTYVEDIEAAGVLFHTPTGHMLLMKRADTGQWSIPAGGLEGNEEPLQAAQRESAEETGNPGDHKAVKVDERTTSGVHFHTFAQPAEWQFAPILNPEHTKYGWFQKQNLPKPLHPGLAATMHAMSEGGVVPFADARKQDVDGGSS